MAYLRGVQPDGSWHVYAGDHNSVRWRFVAGGAPWDLTGTTVEAHARRRDTDVDPALVADVTVIDGPTGVVDIAWDGEAVRALLDGVSSWEGVYDMQLTAAGDVLADTMIRAKMRAFMDVTRP
jgi:hypothetical protein